MNVLVIPEDFRKDQYILKPLIKRLFAATKPWAKVDVCTDPLLGGVGEALKSNSIRKVVEQHDGMFQVFILCVDRDGDEGRRQRLDQIEKEFGDGREFLAVNAWEEIETWVLAGMVLPTGWRWQDVRREVDVKERYFDELARQRGVSDGPSGGRKVLAEEAARKIRTIRQKCPEDFNALAQSIESLPETLQRG